MILKNTLNEDYTYFVGDEEINFRSGEIKIVRDDLKGKHPSFLIEVSERDTNEKLLLG